MLSREKLILSTGTAGNPPLAELIAAARAGGFAELAVWPADYQAWRAAGTSDEQARAQLEDAGIRVAQVDCLLMWMAGETSARAVQEERDVFAAAAAFGAPVVSVIGPGDDRLSEDQLADRLAGVCRRGSAHGFEIALEVAPWKGNIDVPAAVRVATATGCSNVGLVLDNWHMARGGVTVGELRAVPGRFISSVQLSDAPAQAAADLVSETMTARSVPGQGELDVAGFIAALDGALGDREVAVTVEVLSDELRAAGAVDAARRCGQASREVLGAAG